MAAASVQPASANQTLVTDSTTGDVSDAIAAAVTNPDTITDNTTGAASTTLAAGAGVTTLTFPYSMLAGTGAAEVVTNYVLGYKFKILSWSFVTAVAGVGAAASRVFNMEIVGTDVGTVPSTITLIEAGTATVGSLTAGTAVSGANTGSAAEAFSIEVANGGTQFTAGSGYFLVRVQNMDTADAVASLTAQHAKHNLAVTALKNGLAKGLELVNAIRLGLVTLGIIKGGA